MELRVAEDADDLVVELRRRVVESEAMADGLFLRQVLPGERFVHHRHARRARAVARANRAARAKRNAKRFGIAGSHKHRLEVHVLVRPRRIPLHVPGVQGPVAAERTVGRERRAANVRKRSEPLVHPAVELRDGVGLVAGEPRVVAREQHAILIEAVRLALQVHQAAREEARADQEHERDGDLRDNERLGGAEPTAPDLVAADARLQAADEIEPAGVQRRRQPEQQAGDHRDRDGEHEHRSAHGRLHRRVSRHEGEQRGNDPSRREHARDAAERGQQKAFGQQLSDQACASGAQREPHRNLTLPRGRTRQQQIADVRARDDQHERDDGEQNLERLAVLLTETGHAA